MSLWKKWALVLAGYGLAVIAAIAAAWLYNARVSALPYDTSGGMYAGGELLTSLAAFLLVAMAPTLLALLFLRRHERFWDGVAILSIAFAGIGLVAVLTSLVTRATAHVGLMLLDLVGLAHLLGAPLWVIAFVLFALIAPTRRARQGLFWALGIELVVGVFAVMHWFLRSSPL